MLKDNEQQFENVKFDCELKTTKRKELWKGEVKRFINYGSHFEVFIESRSSLLILVFAQ